VVAAWGYRPRGVRTTADSLVGVATATRNAIGHASDTYQDQIPKSRV
jgi:hypothetical protein